MLYAPMGYQVHENVDFRFQPHVNNLASPFNSDHMMGCCTCKTESNDAHVWPLYGEVKNCIINITNTDWSDTLGTGTCFVYIQVYKVSNTRVGFCGIRTCIRANFQLPGAPILLWVT